MPSSVRLAGGVLSLYSGTVTTAGTVVGGTVANVAGVDLAAVQAAFAYGGTTGTTAVAYVQTSLDAATTWMDVACFSFGTVTATRVFTLGASAGTAIITPTDGSLTASTMVPGIVGDRFRIKLVSTGTYGGTTTLKVHAAVKA